MAEAADSRSDGWGFDSPHPYVKDGEVRDLPFIGMLDAEPEFSERADDILKGEGVKHFYTSGER